MVCLLDTLICHSCTSVYHSPLLSSTSPFSLLSFSTSFPLPSLFLPILPSLPPLPPLPPPLSFSSSTHKVTPAAQMSALNPDHESCPEAISGGWKAGLP